MVVTDGETLGFERVELNPAGSEIQLYVFPTTGGAPIEVTVPSQIVAFVPATAAGIGLTVTVILLLCAQPVAVIISVK